jgi:type I restriction enzyme S subunit
VPKKGDILLTSVGTLGIPYFIKGDEIFYFKDGNLTWFKDFSDDTDNLFESVKGFV